MKIFIQPRLILLYAFLGLHLLSLEAQSFDWVDFHWLLGKWERTDTRSGQQAFEEWGRVSDTLYVGKGWTMEGRDTVFEEDLSIFLGKNSWFYEAKVPHNPGAVRFKIVRRDDSGFESVNPDHDFPTNIDYAYDQAGNLTVTISDQKKKIDFQFRKTP